MVSPPSDTMIATTTASATEKTALMAKKTPIASVHSEALTSSTRRGACSVTNCSSRSGGRSSFSHVLIG